MSIQVNQLTKVYGPQKALDNVSFEASSGRITGFLGPNGAGKTTTMKIATGYIQPSSGTILLDGVDVLNAPIEVKRITGYLPEHNPLYTEMYVKEYLTFISNAYKLKNKKSRVDEMVELCGLQREQKKKIKSLSKGYRQRVGLAQTLIHDPKVLILDEPTSGLDPNQLIEIRQVIKQASQNKTVILSTHIMQEVETMCDHVVIINKGKVVADDSVSNLRNLEDDRTVYQLKFESKVELTPFQTLGEIEVISDFEWKISSDKDMRRQIMEVITNQGLPLISIIKNEQSLEHVFQLLTQNQEPV